MNVNGVTVNVGSASNIALWIRTISGGTGCYLLGENLTKNLTKVLYLIGQPITPVVVAELTK
jgi:hypothetical protein